jgi:CHAT domain-containing protein
VATLSWQDSTRFKVFPGRSKLRDIVGGLRKAGKRWAVLERSGPLFYVFSADELEQYADALDDGSAEKVLGLHEWEQSEVAAAGTSEWDFDARPRPDLPAKPSARRLVALDGAGRPSAVGVPVHKTRAPPPDRGAPRGVEMPGDRPLAAAPPSPVPATAPPAQVDAVLSAQGPKELSVGAEALIDLRLELAAGAAPLAHAVTALIGITEKITAILSLSSDALEAPQGRILRLDPPTAGRPSVDAFVVRGLRAGIASVAVLFKQGASQLGTVSFAVQVREGTARAGRVEGHATAARADAADDDVLMLLVDEYRQGGDIRYRYRVHSRPLGLNFEEFESPAFQDRGGSAASTPLAYVHGIYEVVARALAGRDDVQKFARELRGVGVDLCRQLFKDDFAELLWDDRDRIRAVQVTSWEPYIPWELLRLRHPASGAVDERFLCEYRLVRSLSGRMAPTRLRAADWRTLASSYPNGSHLEVGAEVAEIKRMLQGRGITPRETPPSDEPLLQALETPDFDVFHIACHGGSDPARIESTSLVLSDRLAAGAVQPVTVDARTVAGTASLKGRTPLVFLNACETGRSAPLLTAWGGWPQTFWQAGAGAFVGTSWSVRDGPATDFSLAFYRALLDGATLMDAAGAGRAAAKVRPDASWLAYVVYGHPTARVGP